MALLLLATLPVPELNESAAVLQVQAHGGQLLQWAGRFYWVGEGAKPYCNYSANPWDNATDPCYGKDVSQHLNLYSSSNLASWTLESVLLDQARSSTLLPIPAGR